MMNDMTARVLRKYTLILLECNNNTEYKSLFVYFMHIITIFSGIILSQIL
jgi:hypothetical protein